MTDKIHVVCASPPKPNPGMLSVDAGFWSFACRHGFQDRVEFYQLVTSDILHERKKRSSELLSEIEQRESLPFEYQVITDPRALFDDASRVVYWGDFSQSFCFRDVIESRLNESLRELYAGERYRAFYHLFFMENESREVIQKGVSFGGTLLFNSLSQITDPRYLSCAEQYFSQARLVAPRDFYSANQVRFLTGEKPAAFSGVDCSQFLSVDDVSAFCSRDRGEVTSVPKGSIGFFKGRSSGGTRGFVKVLKLLSDDNNKSSYWLPWWYSKSSRSDLRALKLLCPKAVYSAFDSQPPSLGDLLLFMQGFKLIVTDTYHVCVNAWKLGFPAVCVVDVLDPQEVNQGPFTVQRDKRVNFYHQNQLSEFLIYDREIRCKRLLMEKIENIKKHLVDQDGIAFLVRAMRQQVKDAERLLLDALN